jgi:hypothetical protein
MHGGENQRNSLNHTLGYSATAQPAYLKPNSQSTQKEAEEVHRARTTPQPEQNTDNANAKHKKPQTAPTNLCTVNRTQQQTNTKHNRAHLQPNNSSSGHSRKQNKPLRYAFNAAPPMHLWDTIWQD